MPYYNAAKYIKETVGAIIAQTYTDWELIIVDDCSLAPETVEVLKAVEAMDDRIRVLRAKVNGGAGVLATLPSRRHMVDIWRFVIQTTGGILPNWRSRYVSWRRTTIPLLAHGMRMPTRTWSHTIL